MARRAGGFGDCDSHQTNRAAAGDQHFASGQVGGEGGVDRVTEVLQHARDLGRHVGRVDPQVASRHGNVLGPAAVAVDADDLRVLADVSVAGAALRAFAADDMALGGNKIALAYLRHVASHGHDMAAQLVTHHQGRVDALARPFIPFVDVQIGAADGRSAHFDQCVLWPERRNRNLAQDHAWRLFRFHDGLHRL